MNDLVIVENIEKKLQEPRVPTVFPLTPTHRKELRTLRDENVGNLRSRLNTLRTLKREEYQKKYFKDIEKELGEQEELLLTLNKDWQERIKKINKILQDRKKLEEKSDVKRLYLKSAWDEIAKLNEFDIRREFTLNRKEVSLDIAREEFDEKYKKQFDFVHEKIDKIVTSYEEAINFGDLEIVKRLYYIMKSSETFFDKISKLKI